MKQIIVNGKAVPVEQAAITIARASGISLRAANLTIDGAMDDEIFESLYAEVETKGVPEEEYQRMYLERAGEDLDITTNLYPYVDGSYGYDYGIKKGASISYCIFQIMKKRDIHDISPEAFRVLFAVISDLTEDNNSDFYILRIGDENLTGLLDVKQLLLSEGVLSSNPEHPDNTIPEDSDADFDNFI